MELHRDFLIIGSGIAGLRAAAELAGMGDVLILTKAEPREGNTGYAQGALPPPSAPVTRPRCTPRTRSPPATRCATSGRCRCLSRTVRATSTS